MSKKCEKLHKLFNDMERLKFKSNEEKISNKEKIPKNWIYILFEKYENWHWKDRIVRVWTHKGENGLYRRLKQHFINKNKNRSIFRKNIWRVLLNKKNEENLLKEWDLKWSKNDNFKEIEDEISEIIINKFSFVVFQVDDKDERSYFEWRIISTVNHCNQCKQSKNWLWNYSPKKQIRESGLWLVQWLKKEILSDEDMLKLEGFLKKKK